MQSAGCVEIPIANAAKVFPMDPIGTLVTVTTGDLSPELHATPPNCGQFAFEIRIFPWHEMLAHPLEMGLLRRL